MYSNLSLSRAVAKLFPVAVRNIGVQPTHVVRRDSTHN